MKTIEEILTERGIKPTANRILVLRELIHSNHPLSLGELETSIHTLEKSSILRTLTLLHKHHLIHTVEDGRGIIKYEQCFSRDTTKDEDLHVHFYCLNCHEVTCFENIPAPNIPLPSDYQARSTNHMIKGLCPKCKNTDLS